MWSSFLYRLFENCFLFFYIYPDRIPKILTYFRGYEDVWNGSFWLSSSVTCQSIRRFSFFCILLNRLRSLSFPIRSQIIAATIFIIFDSRNVPHSRWKLVDTFLFLDAEIAGRNHEADDVHMCHILLDFLSASIAFEAEIYRSISTFYEISVDFRSTDSKLGFMSLCLDVISNLSCQVYLYLFYMI